MAVGPPDIVCPRCSASVPAEARFCMSCGEQIAAPTPTDEVRHAGLTSAAPLPLVEKMRSAKLSGERKRVTALFVDVVGSTGHLERMDPEDWTAIINEAFDLMSAAVYRYEGTIAQLQGDAMLAFFGAPVAHEDDPERAVLAALDMVASVMEFARQLRADRGIDFEIRAGIDSGPVVVGNVGTDLRYEYTALGDAVNVAARLQAAAQPGQVLVTAGTLRLLGGQFDVEDLGPIELKGKSTRVATFRVLGRREAPGRRRGLEGIGISSPMVGRDEPLATLLGQFDVARAGRGRLAFIVGEPGIGKSRLLAELRLRSVDEVETGAPVAWIEGRCVSYGRSLPYHLVLDLVRSALGLSTLQDDPEATRAILETRMREIDGDEGADVAPYLAHLLGLPPRSDDPATVMVDPEMIQGRYAAAVTRLLRALSREHPTIVVLEDLHWADEASVALLQQVLPLAVQLPVLVVATMREETDSHGWQLLSELRATFGQALAEIALKPLDDDASRELVGNLLVIDSLPARVRDLILERADGNPFFVEEVVRMLIERGLIERRDGRWQAVEGIDSVEIPETLHGLLLARIDQLPEEARRSLRIAAVIGRQFPLRVLEQVLVTSTAS